MGFGAFVFEILYLFDTLCYQTVKNIVINCTDSRSEGKYNVYFSSGRFAAAETQNDLI